MSSNESPRPADPATLPGSVVADQYRLVTLVSTGADTVVFDAVDESHGRSVTVKLVRPDAADDAFVERFDETMRRVASLSQPNIAAVFDWGTTSVADVSQPFVVSEYLGGGSLRDMFDRSRQLSPSQALAVGLDACRALDYAHRRGFVHSELTPSKLVFGDDRRLRVVDFGLAALLNGEDWQNPAGVATHTAWYASPEQARSEPVDGRTDVYALALTLHEAVTGSVPFKHDSTVASLSARMGRLMPVSADLGPLASVLEHAGRPDRDERSSAAQFGKELVQAASNLPRPEPLPLLSSSLFETPADQLRSPDDPTGGLVRPASADAVEPGRAGALADDGGNAGNDGHAGDDLVILPLDSDVGPSSAIGPIDVTDPVAEVGPDDAAAPQPSPEPVDHDGPAVTSVAADGGDPDADLPDTDVFETTEQPAEPAPGSSRRRPPWLLLLAVLVAAALVVLGVLASSLFTSTPSYTVPDLVELPEAEARNLIAANGWEVSVEQSRSDQVPESGLVISSSPRAGVDLAEGEPFLIVVSEGPTLRQLPDSTGVPLADAQTRLVERGLDVAPIVEEFDEDVPEGTVIRWSVPGDATLTAGSMVEPGLVVELVVSEGPAPRSVPNLAGLTVAAARAQLTELGLTLSESVQEFSDDVPLGSVISQAVEPGTEVERGSDVAVVVSKGPDLVTFPDLAGAATYEEAAVLLAEAGFVPNLVLGDAQGAIERIRIDGEEPGTGQTFRRGTQVDITAV